MPLTVGALIYIGARPTTLYFVKWLQMVGAGAFYVSLRSRLACVPASEWIVFNLPDALFAHAVAFAFATLWQGHASHERFMWAAAVFTLTIAPELGQALSLVPGTFDSLDILGACLGTASGYAFARARGISASAGFRKPALLLRRRVIGLR